MLTCPSATEFFSFLSAACNVILRMPQGVFTLRNYGQPMNCSVSILYPQSIRIISNSIGTKPLLIEGDASLERKPSNYYDYQLNKNQTEDLNEPKPENNTIPTTDNVSRNAPKSVRSDASQDSSEDVLNGCGLTRFLLFRNA